MNPGEKLQQQKKIKELNVSRPKKTGGILAGFLALAIIVIVVLFVLLQQELSLNTNQTSGLTQAAEDVTSLADEADGFEDVLAIRGLAFDFAIKNRFDYVPVFEEGNIPTESSEYLFFAFIINLDNWGDDKGVMTKEYVEQVAKEYFNAQNINHGSMRKGWNFDGEKYTAVPSSVSEPPIYVLEKYETYQQDGLTVYALTMSRYTMGGIIPSDDDMKTIRQNIIADDLSKLDLVETEIFKFYFDDKNDFDKENDMVVFLSHTLKE